MMRYINSPYHVDAFMLLAMHISMSVFAAPNNAEVEQRNQDVVQETCKPQLILAL